MSNVKEALPLKQRPFDWFFIASFSWFAWTSFFVSSLSAFKVPVTPDSDNFLVGALYWYGSNVDPLFAVNPLSLQIQSFADTFIFGPFYLCLVYALVRGKNWIRLPALLYVSAITYSMIVALGTEYLGDSPPLNNTLFLAINLPYLLVPLALGYRLRHPSPFGLK